MPVKAITMRHIAVGAAVSLFAVTAIIGIAGLNRPAPHRVYVDVWSQGGFPTVRGFMTSEDSAATGLRAFDRIVSVGGIDLDGVGQLGFMASVNEAAWTTAGPVPFLVERDGDRLTLMEDRPAPRRGYFASVLIGMIYLLLAVLVALKAPPTLNNWMLFLFMAVYGLSRIDVMNGPAAVLWYSLGFKAVCVTAMPLILLAMLGIPPEANALRGRNLFWPWLFLPFDAVQYVPKLAFPFSPALARSITSVAIPVFIVVVMAVLALNFRRSGPAGRRQVKWAMLGVYVGAFVALGTIALYGWEPLDPPPVWIALYVLQNLPFPLALFIAVSRFDMLDVDRFIGVALAYNVAGVALIGGGLVLFPVLTEFLAATFAIDPAVGRTSLAFGTAGLLVVAQTRLSPQVDRLFFKERFALDQAMKELPEMLATARTPNDLWGLAGRELVEVLRPANLVIFTKGSGVFAPQLSEGAVAPSEIPAASPFIEWVGELKGGVRLDRSDTAGVGSLGRAILGTLATQVVVPVRRGGELEGFLCIAEKRSGDIYSRTDLTLLNALAQNMSVHLMRFTDAELLAQTRAIQEKMRRYVPGALAQEIELGRELETGEREVSVLFVDIRGYTAYAEAREAPEIFSTINRYTEVVSTIVHDSGGVVVEFNGDGMMAVFGAPRPLMDKERAAVQAAVRLVEEVPKVGDGERVDAGVGIATGLAYVGNIEAFDRTIWSALGRTTNLAARLQNLTRELNMSVLIDSLTKARAGDAADHFLGTPGVQIRGKEGVETLFGVQFDPPATHEGGAD